MDPIENAREYVSASVDSANLVLTVVDLIREKWMTVLESDRDFSDTIAGAEAMRTEIITGSYPQIVASLFSQPPETDALAEADDPPGVEGAILADRLEQSPRAGRGQE